MFSGVYRRERRIAAYHVQTLYLCPTSGNAQAVPDAAGAPGRTHLSGRGRCLQHGCSLGSNELFG
jgi:hypothetical protein